MRQSPNLRIENYRVRRGSMASTTQYGNYGAFIVPSSPRGRMLLVIVSEGSADGEPGFGWEHVSVSLPDRTPTWEEMCLVKDLFFRDDETVIQYHPPKSSYVNAHNFCLHLWRHRLQQFPMPPVELVGPQVEADEARQMALDRSVAQDGDHDAR